MFQMDNSEELTVGDLKLFDKNMQITDKPVGRVIQTEFQQERRPLTVIVRPYV